MNDQIIDARKPGWLWLDNSVIDDYAPQLGAYALAVYVVLVRYADRAGQCFPSQKTLADTLHLSRNTIKKALDDLVAAGLLHITPRRNADGDQDSHLYTLLAGQGGSPHDQPPSRHDQRVGHDMTNGWSPRAREQDLINKTQRNNSECDAADTAPAQPAPPSRKAHSKPPAQTPPDPPLAHPAVVKYRDLAHLTPGPAARASIAESVTDLALWEQVVKHWLISGYRPANVAGMLDWYRSGGLPPGKNGNSQHGSGQGASSGPRRTPAQQAAFLVMQEITAEEVQ